MADVALMAARELRHPVAGVVLVKPGDEPEHA
jgi:hypothetical protein